MSSTRRAVPKPSVLILCLFALSLAGCLTPGIPAPAQDPATYYRDRGDELLSQGKYNDALAEYNTALLERPDDSYALGQRGECYRMLARYDEAVADFSRALQLDPENAWTLARRGESYRSQGKYQLAINDLNRSLTFQPDNDWALASRADAYRMLERYPEAIADFTRALELSPEYPWAVARRGEVYRQTKEYPKALADLDLAIQQAPADSFAYASRGQVLKETGEYDRALADFNTAIDIDPGYAWAKDRLAELRQAMSEKSSPPAELPLITVLDFSIENLPKSEGRLIVDLVFSALVSARRYRVLDRGQRDNILKEIEFSFSQCADEKCQLEIGRLLAADKIVVGSLGKVGQRYILNAKMLDVRTGEAVSSAYRIFGSLEELVDGSEAVALSLSEG